MSERPHFEVIDPSRSVYGKYQDHVFDVAHWVPERRLDGGAETSRRPLIAKSRAPWRAGALLRWAILRPFHVALGTERLAPKL